VSPVELEAEVSLTFNQRAERGTERGSAEELNILCLVATATLSAIERLSEERLHCRLAEINRVRAFGRELVIAMVDVEVGGEQAQLLGKCYVTTNLEEAAARAVLDATNRYFEYALESHH
jgi:hypothetical protein